MFPKIDQIKMNKDIVIGCDGGGSKTIVRIADETGKILGEKIGGASNPNYTTKEILEQTFKQTFQKALSNHGRY